VSRFEYIADAAKAPAKSWSNIEKVAFHYFNPNGLYAAKKVRDAEIRRMVNDYGLPSGALLAYGSLNDYYTEALMDLYRKKHVSRLRLMTVLEGLRYDIKMADKWIAENSPDSV
jgi:hypothetical protein